MNESIYFTLFSDIDYSSNTYHTDVNTAHASFASNNRLSSVSTDCYDFSVEEQYSKVKSILALQGDKNVTGLLPPGVVAMDDCVVIFEAPPRMVNVEFYSVPRDYIQSDQKLHSAYIPVPWQAYVIIHDKDYNLIDTYMYYTKYPISQYGYNQPTFLPVLPNFYSNGLLCRPFYSSANDVNMYSKDVSGVIAAAYDAVWNSGWNMDLVDTIFDFYSDLRKLNFYGRKDMVDYFSSHQVDFMSRITSSPGVTFSSRETAFFNYVNLIKDLNQYDALHLIYPIVSFAHTRSAYVEQLKERFTEEYYSDSDEEYFDEDDLSSYVDDNILEIFSNPSTFSQILSYILESRYDDFYIIDPIQKDYYKHIYRNIALSQTVPQYSSTEEPF